MSIRPLAAVLFLSLCFAPGAVSQHLAYEKYRLDNGMTVILHVDRRLPIVTINTWYRVGSKDEPRGRSGFAHLFEHLMFMGTQRVPGNDFDVLMENGGGSNNASTTEDRTNYFSSGPAELLPTLLWLDADRLEDLGRTMTQEKLDRQRDVVRNEIRQNVENTPYQRCGERVFRVMFPQGHPYHEAVYGTHEDLEAATVGDVKDFFATFYVPNNASLVVAGDFDKAQVKPLIQQLFGTLPRGGDVSRKPPFPAALQGVVRTTMLDRVQLPLLKMVWHSPAGYTDGDAEMSLCAMLLTSGKSSRLYRRLVVEERLATMVSANQDSLSLGGLFTIDVSGVPGADLTEIERIVDEELQRLREQPPDATELGRHQAGLELGRLSRLQSLGSVADSMNRYEFVWGEPDSFERDLDRYRKATPQGVQRQAQQTLDLARRAIFRVLPEQPERAVSARDRRPGTGGAGSFEVLMPETFQLKNGVAVHYWQRAELPLMELRILFQDGHTQDASGRAGLAALAATMLQEGTEELDAPAFADAMRSLGGSFRTWADRETANAALSVLQRNFDRAAALAADALRRPRLGSAEYERLHRLTLAGLQQADDQAAVVANRVGMRVLFGSENAYGWPVGGTVETVTPFSLADVKQALADLFRPSRAVILLAGSLPRADAQAVLEKTFGDWQGERGEIAAARDLLPAAHQGMRVVIVHRPEAVQTVMRLYAPGPRYRTPERLRHRVLATVLGGTFTSRLNQNLREQHGYTYGAGASWSMAPQSGWFGAAADVRTDVTGASVKELLGELRRIATPEGQVTADELKKAQQTLRTAIVEDAATLAGIVGTAAELVLNGMPFTTVRDDLAALAAMTLAEVNTLARTAVPLENSVLVLVGDRSAIGKQLEPLGLPVALEVDAQGRALAR
ncbi:MAG TPA: pitrilysin family protein [Planctomycetota bacterium]